MAYRFEKEQNGKEALVIDGWQDAIGADPYSGLGIMKQVDLETPGEVAVGFPITASTVSGATMSIPVADSTRFFPTYTTPVGVPTGAAFSYAMLDASGQVFEATSITGTWNFLSSSNSTTGSSSLDGLVYWLGYLWKFRNNAIDIWNGSTWYKVGWDPTTGGTGGTPITAGAQHYAYVASDNILYFTNGNCIGRIFAPTPSAFNPATPSTYAFSANILALPVTDYALSIAEVGGGNAPQSTLLIGGAQNAIYPWDKISSSFALPIYVADPYIGKMVSANQNAFIFPGSNTSSRGRIYITNGSQADLYYKIPDYIFGQQDPYYWWGDCIFHRNNLVFGFIVIKNSDGSSAVSGTSEVWALNLGTKAFRSITTLPLNGQTFTSPNCLIAAVNPSTSGFSYIVGWRSGATGGIIGYSGTTAGIGSATLNTDLMPIGSFTLKETFSNVEFKLRSPLESGENIVITPISDTVTGSALVFSPTPTTGSISAVAPVNWEKGQWLQFKVDLTGNSATSGCRLKEIRVRL